MSDKNGLNSMSAKSSNIKEAEINDLTTPEIFRMLDLYFYRKNYIFRHLYNSYDKFLTEDVRTFLEKGVHVFNETFTPTKIYRRKFKFENTRVVSPTLENRVEPMFPSDARHKNLTYNVTVECTVTQIQEVIDIGSGEKNETVVGTKEDNNTIAIIPLMVRSKYCSLKQFKDQDKNECEYDPGGYFIVNGSEKVVICQDRMVENKPLVFTKKDSGTVSTIVQINSRSSRATGMSQVLTIKMKKDGIMTIRVPILNEINVLALFRALGIESDKDIISCIVGDEADTDMAGLVRKTLDTCKNEKDVKIQTQEEAIDFLINKLRVLKKYTETDKDIKIHQKKMHLMDLLNKSLLPHIEGSLIKKAYYLGYAINRLCRVVLGRIPLDDRDSYVNKRVDLPGDLLFELFKQQFKKMMSECDNFFKKRNDNDDKPMNIINQIKPNIIEQGLKASLLTGAWIRRKGVAQMLQRLTYVQTLAFLRRIDAQSGDATSSKLTKPRQQHPSSIGFLCVSTPEHAKVGLTKHFSIIGSATIMSEDQYNALKELLYSEITDLQDISFEGLNKYFKVLLNGEWLGVTNKPVELITKLRNLKQKGSIDQKNVSIIADYKEGEVRVYCDSGRLYRPVIRVEDNVCQLNRKHIEGISLNKAQKSSKITDWDEFTNVHTNVVEYIDMEQQPYCMIAENMKKVEEMRLAMLDSVKEVKNVKSNHSDNRYNDKYFLKYSHCEFHPSVLIGEIATNTPFLNMNQGPRILFNYAQSRQAMGIYVTNYRDRLDISYILYHTQKPLVTTRTSKYLNTEILPAGENAMVAIACYTG